MIISSDFFIPFQKKESVCCDDGTDVPQHLNPFIATLHFIMTFKLQKMIKTWSLFGYPRYDHNNNDDTATHCVKF